MKRIIMMLPSDIELLYKIKDKQFPIEGNDEEEFYWFLLENYNYSYSQSFQDLWILYEYQKQKKSRFEGYFVEFGAHDGMDGSNTLILEKKWEWRGILAEPNPLVFEKLVYRSGLTFSDNRAVFNTDDEEVSFVITNQDNQYSTIQGFENLDYNAKNRQDNQIVTATTVKLSTLLEEYDAPEVIDYISVDTEGSELVILESFFGDENKHTVNMWTVEHNWQPAREQIHRLMTNNGYVRKFEAYSRWDDFYIKKELA